MTRPHRAQHSLRAIGLLLLSLFAATQSSAFRPSGDLGVDVQPLGAEPAFLPRHHEPTADEIARRDCEQKVRAALQEPALPGAPKLDTSRDELLFAVKAEPVLFVSEPRYIDDEPISEGVQSFRKLLATSSYPWDALAELRDHFRALPRDGRAVLLKDGYLYADSPALGKALLHQVSAQHLFGHDRIWIQRGENTYFADRRKGNYYWADGPNQGDAVRLLLFDRIGFGEPNAAPLHRDLRSLRYRLNFTRMQVQHVSSEHVVALLQYGNRWVPSLLKSQGARLELECEIADPATRKQVEAERSITARRQLGVQVLRDAMLASIAEGLPFDEPRHEYGMQFDGRLRVKWRAAYYSRKKHYDFTGDQYDVYDRLGRPLVPQVCVDFLTDTFERASGTWYNRQGQPPGKTRGTLDFGTELDKPWLRRAPDFVNFASQQKDWFDVLSVSGEDQVPIGERETLLSYLDGHVRDFQPGDVIILKGYTPWDPRTMHFHSFFVYESDPLTGLPIAIVGNAGRPSLRVWETESKRTPKRAIHYRLRPNVEWMEKVFAAQLPNVTATPMTLTPKGVVD
jgi:hypothetical protein